LENGVNRGFVGRGALKRGGFLFYTFGPDLKRGGSWFYPLGKKRGGGAILHKGGPHTRSFL